MNSEIIVDIDSFQTRVVLMEDDNIAEVYVERTGKEKLVGNIYKGRVANILPGMQAAFVDIGLSKNAFLYAGDILIEPSDLEFSDTEKTPEIPKNIKELLKQDQELMVQIIKEPVGTKGARITTHITLPGRMCVLMPTVDYIGVSRRIEDEQERARLREMAEKGKPEGKGIIVRTAAKGKSEEDFLNDVEFLCRLWNKIQTKFNLISAPRVVHSEEPLVFRTIRDIFTRDIDKLIINSEEYFERIKVIAGIISPRLKDRVYLYKGNDKEEIFEHYGLEKKLDKLLNKKVWLKNGGYIIIDQTEALTAIDVNTGKYVGVNDLQHTLFETNVEAAKVIAAQLRLKDISGIIIIDFIDMEEDKHKERLLEAFKNELKKDRTKTNVVGMTGLGLVEMTRKKMRKSLSATMQSVCPTCKGEGKIPNIDTTVMHIRKKIISEFEKNDKDGGLIVHANPSVIQYILNHDEKNRVLPIDYSKELYFSYDNTKSINEFTIDYFDSKEMKKNINGKIVSYY